jgi:hypothetical protein
MEEGNQEISEFNESALQIQRIHNHLVALATARENGNFNKVKWILDSIENELFYDAEKISNTKEDYVKQLNDIDEKIEALGISRNQKETYDNLCKLYKTLIEKERLLRRIQQISGKGSRYKDSDDDEM